MAKARNICTHKKCCKQESSISGERQQLESSVAIVRRDPDGKSLSEPSWSPRQPPIGQAYVTWVENVTSHQGGRE